MLIIRLGMAHRKRPPRSILQHGFVNLTIQCIQAPLLRSYSVIVLQVGHSAVAGRHSR